MLKKKIRNGMTLTTALRHVTAAGYALECDGADLAPVLIYRNGDYMVTIRHEGGKVVSFSEKYYPTFFYRQ